MLFLVYWMKNTAFKMRSYQHSMAEIFILTAGAAVGLQIILASRNRSPPAGTTNYTEKLITNLLSKYLPLLKRVPLDKSQDYLYNGQ